MTTPEPITIIQRKLNSFIVNHVSGRYDLDINWKEGKWGHAHRVDIKLPDKKGNAIIASFESLGGDPLYTLEEYVYTIRHANKRYCGYSMILYARLVRFLKNWPRIVF